jgi:hypothetical protein
MYVPLHPQFVEKTAQKSFSMVIGEVFYVRFLSKTCLKGLAGHRLDLPESGTLGIG